MRLAGTGIRLDPGRRPGALSQLRVTALGLRDHRGREVLGVVGAAEPERGLGGDRKVQEGLVELALGDLDVAATSPDGLADAPCRPAPGGADEGRPGGDDAGGVRTQELHVDEVDGVGAGSECIREQTDPSPGRRHHDRLTVCQTVTHEGDAAVDELVLTAPQHRLMSVVHDVRWCGHCVVSPPRGGSIPVGW